MDFIEREKRRLAALGLFPKRDHRTKDNMDFIEREKRRLAAEQQAKKEAQERERKEAEAKALELQNKRQAIWDKVGPFLEELLQKTIEKHEQAKAEGLPDIAISELLKEKERFEGWKWEIDWVDPRLWGHFESVQGVWTKTEFDNKRKIEGGSFNHNGETPGFLCEFKKSEDGWRNESTRWIVYIIAIPVGDQIKIKAKAEKHYWSAETTTREDERGVEEKIPLRAGYLKEIREVEDGIRRIDRVMCLQGSYLDEGILMPIEQDPVLIEKIADQLVEIRYTWKLEEWEDRLIKAEQKRKAQNALKEADETFSKMSEVCNGSIGVYPSSIYENAKLKYNLAIDKMASEDYSSAEAIANESTALAKKAINEIYERKKQEYQAREEAKERIKHAKDIIIGSLDIIGSFIGAIFAAIYGGFVGLFIGMILGAVVGLFIEASAGMEFGSKIERGVGAGGFIGAILGAAIGWWYRFRYSD